MLLDGTLCEMCGQVIFNVDGEPRGAVGYPDYDSPDCARDRGATDWLLEHGFDIDGKKKSSMVSCTKCKKKFSSVEIVMKIIPTGHKEKWFPKWTIQLKEKCPRGHYLKFANQTPELIEAINDQLEGADFVLAK